MLCVRNVLMGYAIGIRKFLYPSENIAGASD